MSNKAIIFGATGAIGRQLIKHSTGKYEEVWAVVRERQDDWSAQVHQVVVREQWDANNLPELTHSDVYVAIGTTKAKTPDQLLYFKIDHDIPVAIAKRATQDGARSLHVVSALGADSSSRIFYNATKGKMESDVWAAFAEAYLYRPSLLMGERQEKRIGERIAQILAVTLRPLIPKKYRGIHVAQVALMMLRNADHLPEKKIWESGEMQN